MAVAVAEDVTSRQDSGRYQFSRWALDSAGNRVAIRCGRYVASGRMADLMSTAYRNRDGSQTAYAIAFDLDAHRADPKWLDGEGRLDWDRMGAHLKAVHPEIAGHISHVVRSTGGRGLAVLLAVNPMPLQNSTVGNQKSATNLQSRLITLFNGAGFGADPAARGLVRDFPSFLNPSRCLVSNDAVLRFAEAQMAARSGVGVVTQLHTYLNAVAAEQQRDTRLYPDLRAERGLARLVLWLTGAWNPEVPGLRVIDLPGYLCGDTVEASTKLLCSITGLSDKFLRKFLASAPAWLTVEYLEQARVWRLCMPMGRAWQRLLPRAEAVFAMGVPTGPRPKLLVSVAQIERPEFIADGERNLWLTSLALAYKWAGLAREEALAKILLRMTAMPDYESSRNCRSVRQIVKAIYNNVPGTFGRFDGCDLPAWMVDDSEFGIRPKGTNIEGVIPREVCGDALVMVRQSAATPPKLTLVDPLPSGSNAAPAGSLFGQLPPPLALAATPQVTLVAIRWRQRVGVFDGEHLVVCMTKRHYRAGVMLSWLGKWPQYQGVALRLFTPHMPEQIRYRAAIDAAEDVRISGDVLGQKEHMPRRLPSGPMARG